MSRALSWVPFLVGCAAIWMVSNLEKPPVPDALSFKFSDKLLHAVAYGGLAVLATLGARSASLRRMFLVAAGVTTLYGVVDEVHQSFTPGRSPSVGDVVADALGASAGAAVVCGLVRRRRVQRAEAAQAS